MSEESNNRLSIKISLKGLSDGPEKDEAEGTSRQKKERKQLKDWAREFVEENHEEIAELAKR